MLLGDPVMLRREQQRVYAFYDQCPHRGIPLSVGRQDFPGTWACRYHGCGVADLESRLLKAALTDGPDSPICGKVRVRTYPVAERAGLIWVYGGTDTPPPVEDDIPEQFLDRTPSFAGGSPCRGELALRGRDSFDAGHANYLHRSGNVRSFFRKMPAWSTPTVSPDEGGWLTVQRSALGLEDDYPGLGHYPPRQPWRRVRTRNRLSIRLPGIVRLKYDGPKHCSFLWLSPVDAHHYRLLQFYVMPGRGLEALRFRLEYELYFKPFHHIQFNNQDTWMVSSCRRPRPSACIAPTSLITAWRKLCEQARGEQPVGAPSEPPWRERDEADQPAVPVAK